MSTSIHNMNNELECQRGRRADRNKDRNSSSWLLRNAVRCVLVERECDLRPAY